MDSAAPQPEQKERDGHVQKDGEAKRPDRKQHCSAALSGEHNRRLVHSTTAAGARAPWQTSLQTGPGMGRTARTHVRTSPAHAHSHGAHRYRTHGCQHQLPRPRRRERLRRARLWCGNVKGNQTVPISECTWSGTSPTQDAPAMPALSERRSNATKRAKGTGAGSARQVR
jgi:hypothetical protein